MPKQEKQRTHARDHPYDNSVSSNTSNDASSAPKKHAYQKFKQDIAQETDPNRIAKRQKQVDFGKNTIGYDNYTKHVPREQRDIKLQYTLHPATPDVHQSCSKRAFDGQLAKWRRLLHLWDSGVPTAETVAERLSKPDNKMDVIGTTSTSMSASSSTISSEASAVAVGTAVTEPMRQGEDDEEEDVEPVLFT
eukprot:GILJ01010053.1.p1 GENE.GILJ01010053.1~~GILJ01010053.1.p1  ORF type:complete len:192 (-),score=27.81 GILJ01010053.1:215-790(-)